MCPRMCTCGIWELVWRPPPHGAGGQPTGKRDLVGEGRAETGDALFFASMLIMMFSARDSVSAVTQRLAKLRNSPLR